MKIYRHSTRLKARVLTSLKENYLNKLDNGCWEWIGSKWKSGYGKIMENRKYISAHRYFYRLYKGDFDPQLDVLHSCDNPSCVNPDHLQLGTHSDNMKDMYSKGRRTQAGKHNANYKHGKYTYEDL